MSSDDSNPYFAPPVNCLPDEQFRRPLSCAIVAAIQLASYCVLVFWGAALLPYLVLGGMVFLLEGLPDMMVEECISIVLAIVFVPACGWLAREEIRCFRAPTMEGEKKLSCFAMLATAVPVSMFVFWFYKYLALSASTVSFVPAVRAAVFSVLWFASGAYRFVRVTLAASAA